MRRMTIGAALCICLIATMAVAQDRVSQADNRPVVYLGTEGCTNGGAAVFTQTPDQVNGLFSDANCPLCGTGMQAIADQFTLAADTIIDQVNVWGGYFPGNSTDDEPFNVIFHANGGVPGANIDNQSVNATSQNTTGVVIFGVNELFVVLDLNPVALTAGTYWLEVTTNTVGNADQFFWETATGPGNAVFDTVVPGGPWVGGTGTSQAVILCESVVPVELMSYDVE